MGLSFIAEFGGSNIFRNFDHVCVFQPVFDNGKDTQHAESEELDALN